MFNKLRTTLRAKPLRARAYHSRVLLGVRLYGFISLARTPCGPCGKDELREIFGGHPNALCTWQCVIHKYAFITKAGDCMSKSDALFVANRLAASRPQHVMEVL